MGDVSLNQQISNEPPSGSIAKQGDQVVGLMSAGWTNERHSTYISSMEASFLDQLYGHENRGLNPKRSHLAGNGFKGHQGDACKNMRSDRNDAHTRDMGVRCLPENPWVRRFKPRHAGVNHRGDGMEDSVDDYGSGTDTVQERVRTHGREVKTCAGGDIIGKSKEVSDQNFSEEEVRASDEPCKKRRPTSSAVPNDQPTLSRPERSHVEQKFAKA